MRHKKSGKKLNRNPSHRKALLRNMARSLLTHERIRTTESRAKALRSVMDKLITLALRNDLHARRQAYRVLENHGLVQRLFDEIGPRFKSGGGYTRVVKLAMPRPGDAAPMAMIEFAFPAGEAKTPAQPAAETTPAQAPETETQAEAEAEAETETETQAEAEAEAETETETQDEAEAETEPEAAEPGDAEPAPDQETEKKD